MSKWFIISFLSIYWSVVDQAAAICQREADLPRFANNSEYKAYRASVYTELLPVNSRDVFTFEGGWDSWSKLMKTCQDSPYGVHLRNSLDPFHGSKRDFLLNKMNQPTSYIEFSHFFPNIDAASYRGKREDFSEFYCQQLVMSKGDRNSRPKIPDDFLTEMLGLSYLGFQHLVKVIEQLEGRSDPQAAKLLSETLKNPSMNAYVADEFVKSVLTKGKFNLETMKALIKAFFSTCEFQKRPEFFLSRFYENWHNLLLSLPDRFQYMVFVAEQSRTQGYSKQLIDIALLDFSNTRLDLREIYEAATTGEPPESRLSALVSILEHYGTVEFSNPETELRELLEKRRSGMEWEHALSVISNNSVLEKKMSLGFLDDITTRLANSPQISVNGIKNLTELIFSRESPLGSEKQIKTALALASRSMMDPHVAAKILDKITRNFEAYEADQIQKILQAYQTHFHASEDFQSSFLRLLDRSSNVDFKFKMQTDILDHYQLNKDQLSRMVDNSGNELSDRKLNLLKAVIGQTSLSGPVFRSVVLAYCMKPHSLGENEQAFLAELREHPLSNSSNGLKNCIDMAVHPKPWKTEIDWDSGVR